jgi:hypothetical protein
MHSFMVLSARALIHAVVLVDVQMPILTLPRLQISEALLAAADVEARLATPLEPANPA